METIAAESSVTLLYTLGSPFALAALLALCGLLSLAHYRALPELRPSNRDAPADGALPSVSIIVPARNEAANLPTLLPSLLALDYPTFEIVLVDDASTDATGAIAEAFARDHPTRLRVLHGNGPEPGWTGKNFACALGARAATGNWLLFTDADTEHAPASLRAAVTAALEHCVGALSLFPRQRCVTSWERLLLPFAFQQYFAGVRPRTLLAPEEPALANGQYFLISRATYTTVGGHAAVASSVIDDVALAGALKRAGYPPLPCRGESLVRVRMYRSLPALIEGFTKNAFRFLSVQRASALLVVLGTACTAGLSGAITAAVLSGQPLALLGVALAYAVAVALLAPWERAFGVSPLYALLAPLAGLGFTLIALNSGYHTLLRRPVRWKGRGYAPTSSSHARPNRRPTMSRRSSSNEAPYAAKAMSSASLGEVSRALWTRTRADERPPGVARIRYHFPLRFFLELGPHLLTGKPRSFRADAALAVRSLPKRPVVEGLERVPSAESFVVVVNHYQRRDLWIGWPGGLLSDALWSARPDLAAVQWVITDRAVVNGASVAWTRPLFLRVARVWSLIPVTPPEARNTYADRSRLHALRACLCALHRDDGQTIALVICPEGEGGSTRGLMSATPGSGRSLLALAASGVPLVPAVVFEEPSGALHARIGQPWHPTPPTDLGRADLDAWAGNDAMTRIAALLPEPLRGVISSPSSLLH